MCILLIAYFFSVWHVEHVGQGYAVVEAEYPEEQQPGEEHEVADPAEEDQVCETDLANPDLQQGKHQIHFKPVSYIYLSFAFT